MWFIDRLLSLIDYHLFLLFLVTFSNGAPIQVFQNLISENDEPENCVFHDFDKKNPQHYLSVSRRTNDCEAPYLSLRKIYDSVHDSKLYGAENVVDLMFARAGKFDLKWNDDDEVNKILKGVVCKNHYDELYLNWDQSKYSHVKQRTAKGNTMIKCSWPDNSHEGKPASFKYRITKNDARSLFINAKKIYPVGLPVCQVHKTNVENIVDEVFSDVKSDPPYCDFEDSDVTTSTIVSNFAKDLGIKRVKTTCDFDELSDRTKRDKVQNAKQLVNKIAEVFAPNAESLLKQKICAEYSHGSEGKLTSAILNDVAVQYQKAEADKKLRRYALSIVSNVIPFQTLQRYIPGLTHYAYYEAKKVRKNEVLFDTPLRRYERYDKIKIKMFLDFITSPAVLISLPYGEKSVKLSDKTKINIPNTVRLQRHAEIIDMFNTTMIQNGYKNNVLPRSTLFSILHHCYASRSKALTCVDYYLSVGMDAFDKLKTIIKEWQTKRHITFMLGEDMQERLTNGRLYLRTDFRINLKEHSPVISHCMVHALSNSDSVFHKTCPVDDPHIVICERCQALTDILSEIKNFAAQRTAECIENENCSPEEIEERAVTTRLVDDAIFDINEMKKHILRATYSDMQRSKIVHALDDNSVLITCDWAQKLLPMKFAESQKDYFGKRGISYHISVATTKINGVYGEHAYVHIIDSSKQDTPAVAAILNDVLKDLHRMGVNKAVLRSDNVNINFLNNYKDLYLGRLLSLERNDFSLAALQTQTNVQILRWTFSEPQAGKSSCDRKAAEVKNNLRNFVDKRNNIETSTQFFDAMTFSPIDFTTTVHAKIISPKTPDKIYAIPGISKFYDFALEADGVRAFHFNGIGAGMLLRYADYGKITSTSKLDIKGSDNALDKLFSPNKDSEIAALQNGKYTRYWRTAIKANKLIKNDHKYQCPDEDCDLSFNTHAELQQHLISENHKPRRPEKLSAMDFAMLSYKEAIEDLSNQRVHSIENSIRKMILEENHLTDVTTVLEGWGQKSNRKNPKKTEAAKKFLKKIFDEGAKSSGKKMTGFEAAEVMIAAKTADGKRMFKADDILRADQIATYFSQLNKESKKGASKTGASAKGVSKQAKISFPEQPDIDEFSDDDDEVDKLIEDEIIVEDEDTGDRVLRRSQRLARHSLQRQAEEEVDAMFNDIENLIH